MIEIWEKTKWYSSQMQSNLQDILNKVQPSLCIVFLLHKKLNILCIRVCVYIYILTITMVTKGEKLV